MTQALSGIEARGGQSTDGLDRPYNETFTYDPLSHLTGRTTRHWDEYRSLADQYANDRNTHPLWSYDADGRVLNNPNVAYVYDASGSAIAFGDFGEFKTDQKFDGDGKRVRSEEWKFDESSWSWQSERVTYYLTSSVLGGAVVTELNSDGRSGAPLCTREEASWRGSARERATLAIQWSGSTGTRPTRVSVRRMLRDR